MKRIKLIAFILVMVMTVSALPVFANAAALSDATVAELEKRLNTAAQNLTNCEVSDLNIVNNQQNANIIYDLLINNAENFHIQGLSTLSTSEKIIEIHLEYSMNKAQYSKLLGELRNTANKMVAGLNDGRYDDVEKALILHDAIADICTYKIDDVVFSGSAWTAYGALVGKKAVCEGYSKAYKYLLKKVGIKSTITASKKLNHAWNIVYLNNTPYHVDVTYDDPLSNVELVKHTYFLCSTQKMLSNDEHKANDFDMSPKATTYDNLDFSDIITPVMHSAGKIYYSADNKLKVYDGGKVADILALNNLEVLLSVSTYRVIAPSTVIYGDGIFYNDTKNIYCYNTELEDITKVYTSPFDYITEIYVENSTLVCREGNSFNATSLKQLNANTLVKVDTSKMFNDVKAKAWYKQYVDYAVEQGIFTGTGKDTFSPNSNITRAQFVQVLANLVGVDTSNRNVTTSFKDVPAKKWYTAAVKWASDNKIVNGVGEGKFDPGANVTREQMCVMLVNFAAFKKITLKSVEGRENFSDDGKISKWAKAAVYTCQQADIVNGKGAGKFDPKGTGTRAEASVMFTKFHKDYMK